MPKQFFPAKFEMVVADSPNQLTNLVNGLLAVGFEIHNGPLYRPLYERLSSEERGLPPGRRNLKYGWQVTLLRPAGEYEPSDIGEDDVAIQEEG